MAYGRTPWSEHHGGSVGAGLGGRLRSSEGEFPKVGRQGDANRLKELTSDAGGRGAQQEALVILLKLDFLQPVEIAQDVVPFGCDVVPVESILEFLDEQQGKEGAEHVAANGHVAAVVDWTSGKHGLGLAEQLLDPQSVAIAQHDLKRGELGVGAQHIEPVKARVFGDPRLVDGEVLGRDGLEIAAETAVADERLVALGELGAQPVEDGTALLGIAPRLGEIATDDVPSVADFDLLGLELGELARNPRHDQRDKGRLIINHGAAHFGTAALAHAEDVFELAFLQRGNALGADHAAVGDDADAADAKTSAQPVDDRQQGGDIGGGGGPQLAAQRLAVLIHDQPDDHLMEIRAVVFRMAATTKLLAAPSLEGQAGGVHEDDAEFGEQVAPTAKQPLFHEVLAAARRQLAGSGLIAAPPPGCRRLGGGAPRRPKPWRGRDDAAEEPQCPRSGSRLATFPQRGPSAAHTAGGAPSGTPRARHETRPAARRRALLTLRGSRPHATAARTAAPAQSADTLHWAGLRPRPATAPSNAVPAGRRSAPAGRDHRAQRPLPCARDWR